MIFKINSWTILDLEVNIKLIDNKQKRLHSVTAKIHRRLRNFESWQLLINPLLWTIIIFFRLRDLEREKNVSSPRIRKLSFGNSSQLIFILFFCDHCLLGEGGHSCENVCRMGPILPLCPWLIHWALGNPCVWLQLGIAEWTCHAAALGREKQREESVQCTRESGLGALMLIPMSYHWWRNIRKASARSVTSIEFFDWNSGVFLEEEVILDSF